jgi:hypothetical protein
MILIISGKILEILLTSLTGSIRVKAIERKKAKRMLCLGADLVYPSNYFSPSF